MLRTDGDLGRALMTPGVASFVARPSVGTGDGPPGVELSSGQLHAFQETTLASARFGTWVSVHPIDRAANSKQSRMPATLRKRSAGRSVPELRDNEIGIDQVIRVALDVDPGMSVTLEAIAGEQWVRWNRSDRERERGPHAPRRGDQFANVLAPAVHVVAQVEVAEMTLTEQNACLLPALALDCLGLTSGDEVVLHATKLSEDEKSGVVHVKRRLKAYVETAEVNEKRQRIRQKEYGPKLPAIWLDKGIREQMGVDFGGAVIVAPSRRYLLADNLREVAIVAAVALGGVAASTDGAWRDMWATLSVAIPVLLIALRLRSRLR